MSYGYQHGYPMAPPPPPPNRTPQILAGVAVAVALIAAVVVAFLFLGKNENDDRAVADTPTVVTVTESTAGQPAPGTVTTVVPHTVTTTPPDTGTGAVSVSGADQRGFFSGPRCNAADDPAMFIGQTGRSRVVICQVGAQTGRYYYLGHANGNTIEIGYPTRSGSTFTAVNGGTSYVVSPSALVITQGGRTLSNEPMVQSWVR
ncbi:MAG: hypothetical protein QM809_17785 [Gordonia sp. (in: high G+C Gram-positive bacteria)]|uniref:hypothetical protein n=1 Tax=Gordonia sp. (in: high G+C Gram-positive bacteria) TaxID=84139 RepID=UPI0039E6F40C